MPPISAALPHADETPRKRGRYASAAMSERRARIVACAHEILAEGGTAVLTIERLSREAEVAPRTIYRLFGDKEGVITATVTERLSEVRAHIAAATREYDLATVFAELDWMVDELRRDSLYARLVIGFYFAQDPREEAVRALGSVAYNRMRNWLDREIAAGHADTRLDLDRIVQDHVGDEYVVYHRWAVHDDDARCRLELRCCFLKTALAVLAEPERAAHVAMLADLQDALGTTPLGARASANRGPRAAGEDFIGRT